MIRSRKFERRFATAVVASVVVLLSFASVAQAIERISVVPGFNGPVNAISEPDSNGTRYLGGNFTAFQPWATGSGALTSNTSGAVDPSFPKVNGSIRATAADGLGGFYIGGFFTCIGPNTSGLCDGSDDVVRNNAAHINANGSVDTSWNPDLNDGVTALALSGSTVYLGGFFSTVGGIARNYAAAVGTDGTLTAWNPNLNSFVRAIGVSGSTVYLGGAFTTVGGIARNRAAAVGTDGTLSTTWNPSLNSGVRAIGVSGSNVYLGGYFTTVGGIARNFAAAVGTDGTLSSWNPDVNDAVDAIGVSGSTVYLGGDFTTVGGIARNFAAAVGTNGTLLGPWPGPLVTDVLLFVTKSGGGAGTVASSPAGIDCGATCSTTFASGTSVTLTATPTTGSSFTGWSGSGCSGTSTCTVTMSAARAVNAEFAVVPPGSFNLAVTKSGTGAGTVTSSPAGIDCGSDCSETLADGSSVTLTATPASGSTFTAWSGSGCSGKSTCTVVMSAARAVDAKFTKKPSNLFPTPKVKAGASALVSTVRVPGPGTIAQRVTRSSTVAAVLTVCKTSAKATKAGWVQLTCKLSKATRAALRQRSLRVSVKTTFTPTGGLPASKTQVVTLKSRRPPPYTG